MKLLVYPHSLEIGGSQLNALEVAGDIRDRGHEVTVFAQPGPLLERVRQLDLRFVEAPAPRRRPSPPVVQALRQAVADTGADVLHAHEWPPGLEAYLAARREGIAVICSIMSMSVAGFLPKDLPVVVGTAQIADHERAGGRLLTGLVEPSVDTAVNSPLAPVDVTGFRRRFGLDDGRLSIVAVTRLAHQLKLEGILTAIEAMPRLSSRVAARLVVVGGGPAHAEVSAAADQVNREVGPTTVVLTGPLDDPRPAYAAADVSLGMGGSALRAMAYGCPLVVQGEAGYFRRLDSNSLPDFLWTGWYGVGAGRSAGVATLEAEIMPLLQSADLRDELGGYARNVAVERFSVQAAATATLTCYDQFLGAPDSRVPPGRFTAMAPAALRYATYWSRTRVARALGREAADDFNARPVAALPGRTPSAAAQRTG